VTVGNKRDVGDAFTTPILEKGEVVGVRDITIERAMVVSTLL